MVSRGQVRKALYGSVSAVALLLAASPAALAGDDDDAQVMQGLQARVAAIRARVQALQASQAQSAQPGGAADTAASVALEPAPPSNAVAAHGYDMAGLGRTGPADAVVGGDFPNSYKLPGSDTSISIRGYVKADFLYDFNQQVGDSFQSSEIEPRNGHALINGADPDRGGFVRMFARESRLTFETRTPTSYGQLKTYIETDFFTADGTVGPGVPNGGFGNSFVTNSYLMRIRKAYATLGPVMAGQNSSLFLNDVGGADTLDFFGPTGIATIRQAQIRYSQAWGKWNLATSMENPQDRPYNELGAPFSGGGSYGSNGANTQHVPDFIGRLIYTDSWGAAQLSGMARNEGFKLLTAGGPTSTDREEFGGLAALWLNNFWGDDTFGIESAFGAVGRYMQGQANDATVFFTNAAHTSVGMSTTNVWAGAVYYTHFWRPDLRSTVAYGHTHSSQTHIAVGNTDQNSIQTLHANLIWSPVKNVDVGIEFIWGLVHYGNVSVAGLGAATGPFPGATSSWGDDKRLQASMKAKFD